MRYSEVVPFIRFAGILQYESVGVPVCVMDCRIFYILSGSAELHIGEEVYYLKPHTVFYCCCGSRYTIFSPGMELICLNFDMDQSRSNREMAYPTIPLASGKQLTASEMDPVEDQEILNGHIFLENGMACRELLENILEEFSSRRILYRETASAQLKVLLGRLLRESLDTASQGAKTVEKIMEYIRTHYNDPMTNGLFSQLFGYHEYYLNRLFAKHTGSTIRQYILDVRIGHAKRLLLNTDLPLSVIAESTGFNSNTYFSSYFRQATGISPAQFRKQRKNAI